MKTSTGTFVLATIFSLVTDVYFICDPSKAEIYISRAKRAEGDGRSPTYKTGRKHRNIDHCRAFREFLAPLQYLPLLFPRRICGITDIARDTQIWVWMASWLHLSPLLSGKNGKAISCYMWMMPKTLCRHLHPEWNAAGPATCQGTALSQILL